MQTAYVRLAEKADTIRNAESVRWWLSTVVRHECLRLLRQRQRETSGDDDLWAIVEPISEEPEPEELAVARDEARVVRGALEMLRARERAVLTLVFTDGTTSYRDAGDRLGMPVGSLGPTRQRALRRLRQRLDDVGYDRCA